MASNSKKRRRVLGASCILAALIIASSSFAWFTSSDEVTNRLSANADYDVRIVESFEPKRNWEPGETINKDVYATNTGSIAAYAKETITGVLTITNEVPTSTFNAAKCVELTEEERYVMEAGSYLAYKPAESAKVLGSQAVIRPADQGTTVKTDFTPDKTGLYVFRRSIDVDKTTQAETFEYEGYYYDETSKKFFKITDLTITPDAEVDLADDGVATDGNLSAATCKYLEEKTETIDPVALEYDATGHKLVATYDTGVPNKAFSDLEKAAARLDAAHHNVEYLTQMVAKATSENTANTGATTTASDTLSSAQTALTNALANQATAASNLLTATTAYNNATNAKNAAQAAYDASKAKLFGTGDATTPSDGSLKKVYDDAKTAKTAWATAHTDQATALVEEVTAWLGTNPTGVDPAHTTFASLTAAELALFTPSAELHDLYQLTAAELIAKTNYENEMMKAYGQNNGSESAGGYETDSLYGKLKAAETTLGNDSSGATKDYNDAVAAKGTADAAVTSAQGAYDTALANYTAAVAAEGKTTDTLNKLTAQKAAADAELSAANAAYDTAQTTAAAATSATDVLKININLANDVTAGGTAEKWQALPNPIANNEAVFYYTSILEGGETSAKLIDSVELDASATQDMYKSFDFDLNVALQSAQINYADDNETILATATTSELGRTATLAQPKNIDTAITWS